MSPPPALAHGNQQNEIGFWLRTLLPQGQVVTECPLSTSDGVKAIDVAWLAPERRQEVHSVSCLLRAPEICVEVLSPSNTSEEISEKIALYFESGAREVWSATRELSGFTFPPRRKSINRLRSVRGFRHRLTFRHDRRDKRNNPASSAPIARVEDTVEDIRSSLQSESVRLIVSVDYAFRQSILADRPRISERGSGPNEIARSGVQSNARRIKWR